MAFQRLYKHLSRNLITLQLTIMASASDLVNSKSTPIVTGAATSRQYRLYNNVCAQLPFHFLLATGMNDI